MADRAGPTDQLQRFLNALKVDSKHDGERGLREYVEGERRDLGADAFAALDQTLQTRIANLAKRSEAARALPCHVARTA